MTIALETISQALSTAAKQRIDQGEPRYRAKLNGLYIGCNDKLVKSKQSALRMFCNDKTVWVRQLNIYQLGYDTPDQVLPLIELELVK